MALEKGWLGKVVGSMTTSTALSSLEGITNAGEELRKRIIPPREEFPREFIPGEVQAKSLIGAWLGAPMGLFPMFSTFYMSGGGKLDTYDAQRAYTTGRLDPETITKLIFRGYIKQDDLDKWYMDLQDQGWSQIRIDAIKESFRPLLGLGEIRDLYLRGELGEGEEGETEALTRIEALGFSPSDASQLIKLFFYIPSATDMIRMVVREAWRDDIAEKYGTDTGYDLLPFDTFAKAGVSPEWLRAYWRSHWELPSIGQGFEMLHRRAITKDDLETLLHTADVMPFWREPLTKIAYTPLTRVDVRRMYKTRVLTEEEVFSAYLDLGYDAENAKRMTDFTKAYSPPEDETEEDRVRNYTKTEILRGYRENVFDRDESLNRLQSIDYAPAHADYLLTLEDVKRIETEFKERIEVVQAAYVERKISDEEAYDELSKLDLSGDQQEYYMSRFRNSKARKAVRPTVSTILRWFKDKLLTEAQFREEMTFEGYSDYYINLYVQEIKRGGKPVEE